MTAGWWEVARGGKRKWIAADRVLSRMLFTVSAWKDCPGVEPEKLDEVDFGFILEYIRTRKAQWSLRFDSRTEWNEQ